MTDLTRLTASEAARLIRSGELTSVALVSACLDRIEALDAGTGAWAFVDPDHALDQARHADRTDAAEALHGVPVGLKDIIDTADMPTEYGSGLYRGHRPRSDAACVALLRAAGAVVLGKTVTTEFGFRHPGKTVNPHNPLHTPGGSSSGSAASVADMTAPLTIGAQTAGSVIRPAAYCGVFGFKPSYGMASYSGIRHLAESFDTLGWMARSVEDLALCLRVLCAEARPLRTWGSAGRPRLALCRTPYWEEAEPQTRALIERIAKNLGPDVEEVDLPVDGAELLEANWTITKFEAARLFRSEQSRFPRGVSRAVSAIVADGLAIDGARYVEALRAMARMRHAINEALSPYDGVLTPSTAGEAPFSLFDTGPVTFNFLWTVAYMPCVTLPAGTGGKGMPLGAQVVASQHRDHALLSAAAWLHGALGGSAAEPSQA
ncbi:amidase [Pseudochelatococcus sp. B33]